MNRQNQKIREITFSGQDAMLLIPPGMLKETVVLCRKAPEALVVLDEFFPPGLREYLMQVLEANRHLPPLFRQPSPRRAHFRRYAIFRDRERGRSLRAYPSPAERS